MSAHRTATPLLASTLALAAGVAAILVGCSRHQTPAASAGVAAMTSPGSSVILDGADRTAVRTGAPRA